MSKTMIEFIRHSDSPEYDCLAKWNIVHLPFRRAHAKQRDKIDTDYDNRLAMIAYHITGTGCNDLLRMPQQKVKRAG